MATFNSGNFCKSKIYTQARWKIYDRILWFPGRRKWQGRAFSFFTLNSVGFNTQFVATSFNDGIERNFIYIAGNEAFNFDDLDYNGIKYTDKKIDKLKDYLVATDNFSKEESVILTDDIPVLDEMLMKAAIEWRKELNVHFRDKFVALGQPIFY